MSLSDRCPKCKKATWRFNLYMHVTAPASFYGNMGKRSFRRKELRIDAALWETASFFCINPKCMYHTTPVKRVRLVDPDKK